MSKYREMNGNRLEQISMSLETSEELLHAIETVSGECFVTDNIKNAAYELWEEGDKEQEILAALPIDTAEEGDPVYWGAEGVFAEFDGEKWVFERTSHV